MKGLLTKDFCLLAGQKRFLIVVFGIAVLFLISGQYETFTIAYMTMLCAFFSISTIHYDEFNKGNHFLFTLPFTRKEYAVEKYVFGILTGGIAWVISTVAGLISVITRKPETNMTEWVSTVVIYLFVLVLMLSLMIPIDLKFGAERGRIASFAVFFVIFGICFLGGELANKLGIDVAAMINKIDGKMFLWGFIAVTAASFAVSVMASVKIMEKKQF